MWLRGFPAERGRSPVQSEKCWTLHTSNVRSHGMKAMIGELVGARYKVINVLASGGFGHTYIAEDTQRPGNPRCVLKHLTFTSQDSAVLQQVRRLFQAEAETLEELGRHDQIPRLLAYFEENHQFYLVQELIDGHPLSAELEKGTQLTEAEVIPLLQDVLGVLEYVHAQGVIHRDIKPANLIRRRQDGKLVLIDFGAVKLIGHTIAETAGETTPSMPVYTSGYAASEQCLGRPRFASDLYSLGMVGIQALTGMHPSQLPHDYQTSELIWRDRAEVSDALAEVLTTMTRYHFNHRYPTASDALHALQQVIATAPTLVNPKTVIPSTQSSITQLTHHTLPPTTASEVSGTVIARSPGMKTATRVGLAIAGTLALVGLVRSLTDSGFRSPLPLNSVAEQLMALKDSDRISIGEKPLTRWQIDPSKQAGIDSFAAGDYAQAVQSWEIARRATPQDAELLIYLNNARIGQQKSYAIAVVTPLGTEAFPTASELLRGVAQAQDVINQAGGINGVPLKVVVADDGNQIDVAEALARKLTDYPDILAVVGHGTSDTTYAAAQIYQNRGVVMIAPVSSAVALSSVGDTIFRTMPSDQQTANALKNYLVQRLHKRKVAVFYNPNSKYSRSLTEEFDRALMYGGSGARVVSTQDLSHPDFDPDAALSRAIAQGAEALMLAPDTDVMDKAVRLVERNNRRLPILAGDNMLNPNLLRFGRQAATGVVLAVPVDLSGSAFLQQAVHYWGKPELVSWRTALAYDATQALAAAIAQNPSRLGIRRTLARPTFQTQGAQGLVNFRPEGDRDKLPSLLTIAPSGSQNAPTYRFVPLPKDNAKSSSP